MTFELATLEKVVLAQSSVFIAREQQNIKVAGKAELQLRADLRPLFALAESCPDLNANDSFLQIQPRINGLENTLADRRERYNDASGLSNIRIE